jgi:hypothetical protein
MLRRLALGCSASAFRPAPSGLDNNDDLGTKPIPWGSADKTRRPLWPLTLWIG